MKDQPIHDSADNSPLIGENLKQARENLFWKRLAYVVWLALGLWGIFAICQKWL